MDDEQLSATISSRGIDMAQIGYQEGTSRRLRYLKIGQDSAKPLLVFLHGAPASGSFWLGLFQDSTLREQADLLAIDRPGYGGSGLGRPMLSVSEQAENVATVIQSLRQGEQPVVVLGSSYGGTVGARLAMDFPRLIDGLLLMSASVAPREEYTLWLTYPTSHWSLSWLMPRGFHSANLEKLSHTKELRKMATNWENIVANTVILHGTDDWLIYPRNAYYACEKLVNTSSLVHHMVQGSSHDLMWTAPSVVRYYLEDLLDRAD